jgi:hypothetical protein
LKHFPTTTWRRRLYTILLLYTPDFHYSKSTLGRYLPFDLTSFVVNIYRLYPTTGNKIAHIPRLPIRLVDRVPRGSSMTHRRWARSANRSGSPAYGSSGYHYLNTAQLREDISTAYSLAVDHQPGLYALSCAWCIVAAMWRHQCIAHCIAKVPHSAPRTQHTEREATEASWHSSMEIRQGF